MSHIFGLVLGLWLALIGPVVPGQAAGPVQQAIAWLQAQQLPDGSFGVTLSDGTYLPSASATADVVDALARAGEDLSGPAWTRGGKSALDALAELAPGYALDAGQTGKVARAVALTGGDPRAFAGLNLVEIIQKTYDPATGRYDPNLLFRHTLAVEGLLLAGEAVPDAAVEALLQAQRSDGGWFWSFTGDQSDVDTTGRVLQLLAGGLGVQAPDAWAKAVHYLLAQQQAAGGWGVGNVSGPPNANSTALAVAGLRAVGYDPQMACFKQAGRGALDALLMHQEPGGAFVYIRQAGREESRLMATVDALNALTQPVQQPALVDIAECRPQRPAPGVCRARWALPVWGGRLCFQ